MLSPELYRIRVDVPDIPDMNWIYFIWPLDTACDSLPDYIEFSNINEISGQYRICELAKYATYIMPSPNNANGYYDGCEEHLRSLGFENVYTWPNSSQGSIDISGVSEGVVSSSEILNSVIQWGSHRSYWPAAIIRERPRYYSCIDGDINKYYYLPNVHKNLYTKYKTKYLPYMFSIKTNYDLNPFGGPDVVSGMTFRKHIKVSSDSFDYDRIQVDHRMRCRSNSYNWESFNDYMPIYGGGNSHYETKINNFGAIFANDYGITATPLACDAVECVSNTDPRVPKTKMNVWIRSIWMLNGQIVIGGEESLPGIHVYGNLILSVGDGESDNNSTYDYFAGLEESVQQGWYFINTIKKNTTASNRAFATDGGIYNKDGHLCSINGEKIHSEKTLIYSPIRDINDYISKNDAEHKLGMLVLKQNLIIHGNIVYESGLPYELNFDI